MQPQDFWQALGEHRLPLLFAHPTIMLILFGIGLIALIIAVKESQRPQKERKIPVLIAIVVSFVFGLGPAALVLIRPQLLLLALEAKSLYDLSPYGVTLVRDSLQSLSYLFILGFLGVLLGTVVLWVSEYWLAPWTSGEVAGPLDTTAKP